MSTAIWSLYFREALKFWDLPRAADDFREENSNKLTNKYFSFWIFKNFTFSRHLESNESLWDGEGVNDLSLNSGILFEKQRFVFFALFLFYEWTYEVCREFQISYTIVIIMTLKRWNICQKQLIITLVKLTNQMGNWKLYTLFGNLAEITRNTFERASEILLQNTAAATTLQNSEENRVIEVCFFNEVTLTN